MHWFLYDKDLRHEELNLLKFQVKLEDNRYEDNQLRNLPVH